VLFEMQRTSVGGCPVLAVRGELDLATAPQLAAVVEAHLAAAPRAVVVDLTHTIFLDSSGARELVRMAKKAAAAGVPLHVVAPRSNTAVRLPIDLLELGAVVPLVESAADIPSGVTGDDVHP
jgi:anti-sigma B factor antagonist